MAAMTAGSRFRKTWMVSSAALAVVLAAAGGALAAPGLDELLSQAMDGHPAVLAAKAKVSEARAALGAAQLEVTRQLTAMRTEFEVQEQAVEKAKKQVETLTGELEKAKTANLKDVMDIEAQLTAAKAALEAAEARLNRLNTDLDQLHALTGRLASQAAPARPEADTEAQKPTEAAGGKMTAVLSKPVDLDVSDAALPDVIKALRTASKAPLVVDAARELGDVHVTLQLKQVRLGAVLQAIEDQCSDVKFAVREYGILATQKEHAREQGFASAVEMWKANGNHEEPAPAPEK